MGRRVHKEAKIAEIYALAQRTIALPMSSSPAATTFPIATRALLAAVRGATAMESQADALLADSLDYQSLKSVPGVGSVIALVILAEAGDLRRFAASSPVPEVLRPGSGEEPIRSFRSREDKLSKRGNARLRWALWMAAMSAARMRENAFRDKYQRYIAGAGGHRSQAQGANS
jgi:transposase